MLLKSFIIAHFFSIWCPTGCGWYLAKVMVREFGDSITYEFVCDRWMSAQDEDGRTVRTLPVTNVIMGKWNSALSTCHSAPW